MARTNTQTSHSTSWASPDFGDHPAPVRTFLFPFDAVFDSVLAVLFRLPSTVKNLDFLLPALTSSIEHNFAHLRTTQAPA